MTNADLSDELAGDGLRIIVEVGEEYAPTPRIAAAMSELISSLREAEEQGVAGFALRNPNPGLKVEPLVYETPATPPSESST